MPIKKINILFKLIIVFLGFCGIGLLVVVAPKIGLYLPDKISLTMVLIILWLTAIPVMYILVNLWQISSNLLKKTIFSEKNSQRLIRIAYAGIIESFLYGTATIIGFFLFKGNYPYFLVCLFFFFLGIVLAVIASLLSYVFKLANQLKDENDLTI